MTLELFHVGLETTLGQFFYEEVPDPRVLIVEFNLWWPFAPAPQQLGAPESEHDVPDRVRRCVEMLVKTIARCQQCPCFVVETFKWDIISWYDAQAPLDVIALAVEEQVGDFGRQALVRPAGGPGVVRLLIRPSGNSDRRVMK